MCKKNEHLLYYQKKKNKSSPNSTHIHCKSINLKHKTQNESSNHISLAKFVANFDTKSSKKCERNKTIHWVSFHLQKNSENYYRELLLLFMPFD